MERYTLKPNLKIGASPALFINSNMVPDSPREPESWREDKEGGERMIRPLQLTSGNRRAPALTAL